MSMTGVEGDADFRPEYIGSTATRSSERGNRPRALSRKSDLPPRSVAGTIGVEGDDAHVFVAT